jgi:transcriptional regulator GlxA family with amidase domain
MLSYVIAFFVAIAVFGYVGLTKSMALIASRPANTTISPGAKLPEPVYDPRKPTVAILLGNTATEATDFLGPYAMFAEAEVYNVYAIASSPSLRTLSGGLDVVPQLTFAELDALLTRGPDIVVIPAMVDIRSHDNVPVLQWLRQQANGHTLLFSWCDGAEVLAESGLVDGKTVTSHWGSIDRYERAYPAVHWQRGMRYIDADNLLTTAGLTSGIDATLHLLEKRNGGTVVAKVAAAIHLPQSEFLKAPRMQQHVFSASDSTMVLNFAFGWPKRSTGIWLYDGVGELDLTAALDVYGMTDHLYTVADGTTVLSHQGLHFVPRWTPETLPTMDRLLVPGGIGAPQIATNVQRISRTPVTVLQDEAALRFPFHVTLEDVARTHDTATASFAAKRLEVRTPLHLSPLSSLCNSTSRDSTRFGKKPRNWPRLPASC